MAENSTCIGLFGTCGNSIWRSQFIQAYENANIQFFNPQVDNWSPDRAEFEAEHLVNDDIILLPITDETYGLGSLAETGFSILQGMKNNRYLIALIDSDVSENLKIDNPILARESLRARALTLAHAKNIKHQNVFFVDSLEKMLDLSFTLHNVVEQLKSAQAKFKN